MARKLRLIAKAQARIVSFRKDLYMLDSVKLHADSQMHCKKIGRAHV